MWRDKHGGAHSKKFGVKSFQLQRIGSETVNLNLGLLARGFGPALLLSRTVGQADRLTGSLTAGQADRQTHSSIIQTLSEEVDTVDYSPFLLHLHTET